MNVPISTNNPQLYAVIDAILDGVPMKDAVKAVGMTPQLFNYHLQKDREAAVAYSRAQEFRADMLADEALHIADTENDAAKARNQITVRQWLASKLYTKKYGDRIDLNVTQTIDIGSTLAEARARLLPMRDQQTVIDGESRVIAGVEASCLADKLSVPTAPPDAEPDIFS